MVIIAREFAVTVARLAARGERNDYAALALWNADTPSLATTRSLPRVYERPSDFPVVAVELPDRGELERCARRN
jgi:hypothetical protein